MSFITIIVNLNTFVSSTNFRTLLLILLSKSLIYIKNNNGPNTDLCCTPLKTEFQFLPPHLLQHDVFSQSGIVLSSRLCSIPWAFNLSGNI